MNTSILIAEFEQRSAAQSQARDGRAFRAVRIVLGLLLVTAAGACNDTRVALSSRAVTTLLLDTTPAEIDFGTLPPNAQQNSSFTLANSGSTPVAIARIDSSCPCVRARLTQMIVPPGEKVELEIQLDLREDPDFAGGLLVEVTGQTSEGRLAFSVRISMTVSGERGS